MRNFKVLASLLLSVVFFSILVSVGCNSDEESFSNDESRAAVTLSNAGFESDFTDWSRSGSTAISTSDKHGGTKSAKISSSTSSVTRTVSVSANTTYTLKAWQLGQGQIKITAGGSSSVSSNTSYSTFTQVSTSLNSGSATTITIGAYGTTSTDVRFDDFTLESGSTSTSSPTSGTNVKFSIPGTSVTASTNDGNVASNTVDGDPATRWSGSGDGAYITFNLGGSKTVAFIKMSFYNGSLRTSTFDIQTSANGSTFTTVKTGAVSALNNNLQTFDFTDVTASYVRIVGHGNSANTWNSYTEVEVWGKNGTNPSSSATATAKPTSSATATAKPSGNLTPYYVLNLNSWKLNGLSGTPSSNTYVDDIRPLETYTNSNWFYTDQTWVYLKQFSGAKTSSSSGNPRTELRELTSDRDEAAWDGTDDDYHTMNWTVKIVRLPKSSDGKAGKICFGQIHGSSGSGFDDVIRTQMEGTPYQTSGSAKIRIMGWVSEENGGGVNLDYAASLNTEMHLAIVMYKGYVYVYEVSSSNTGTQLYKSPAYAGCSSNYFKAGNYMQSMQSMSYDSNNYGISAIKKLNVSHGASKNLKY